MFVYLLTNLANGRYYVGKTVNKNLARYLYGKRWSARHLDSSRKDCRMPVVRAIAKYGWENFDVQILATLENREQLSELEKLWIIALDSRIPYGYNISLGGEGVSGPMSLENRLKIGRANKGRKPVGYARTELHRQQLRDRMQGNNKGVKITPEAARAWRSAETPEQAAIRGASIKAAWARWRARKTVGGVNC